MRLRVYGRTLVILLFMALINAYTLESCALPEIKVVSPSLGALPDGAYEGSYDGGLSKALVRVTLHAGIIKGFEVLKLESGLGEPARSIAERVIAAQSLDVDAVAGATFSSKVILKAAELALAAGPKSVSQ